MKKRLILCIALIAFMALVTLACPNEKLTKLDTPTNLEVEGQMLTWNIVANANEYQIDIDGELHNSNTNSFDLSFLQEPKAYNIKVLAKGDEKKYADSDWSEVRVYQPVPKPQGTEGLSFKLINDAEYEVSKGTANTRGKVEIPAQYNGKPVTRIANRGFSDCTEMIEIVIPSSINYIGERAFYNCSSLTEFTIPSGITVINNYTFSKSGIKSISIPAGVTIIERFAFSECTSLTSVGLCSSITNIESFVFAGCTFLAEITFPSNIELTSLGESVFSECISLTSIEIPSNVTTIGAQGFYKCKNLASITLPAGLIGISERLFYECIMLKNIIIPEGVLSIGSNAFYGCAKLESVSLPATLNSINNTAFRGCDNLTNIVVNEKNTTFKSENNCILKISDKSLILGCKSSIIPDYVEIINYSAFEECKELSTINIPASVKEIKTSAFSGCVKLSSVTFSPNSALKSIGPKAFLGCMFQSIVIPNSISVIEEETFASCGNLKNITFSDNLLEIKNFAFYGCVSLESIDLPDSIKALGKAVFKYCTKLKSFKVPNSTTVLDTEVLSNCISLTSVILHRGVTAIYSYAFDSCFNLTGITIPSNVALLSSDVFANCGNLTIYLEDEQKKGAWHSAWNSNFRPEFWGCTLSEDGTYVTSFVKASTRLINVNNVTISSPTRPGYRFAGWSTIQGGTYVEYTNETVHTAPEGKTLYALWTKI